MQPPISMKPPADCDGEYEIEGLSPSEHIGLFT
jgi:hypothetical protein